MQPCSSAGWTWGNPQRLWWRVVETPLRLHEVCPACASLGCTLLPCAPALVLRLACPVLARVCLPVRVHVVAPSAAEEKKKAQAASKGCCVVM